jgi:hypothetical protein
MFAAFGLASALVWVMGCASAPATRAGAGTPVDEASGGPSELPAPMTPPAPAAPVLSCQARVGTDQLRRSVLKRTVDAGLGRWLQTVSVDPLVARGRFKGWIIRSLDPRDDCYADVDLHAGDVVTRVNGRGVEHPEEALEVWTALPASPELVIDFMRDGRPRTVRFGIVDQ